jgi:acetyl esterase/lipase
LFLSVLLVSNTVGVVAPQRYGSALATLGSIPFIVTMMLAPQILLLGIVLTLFLITVGELSSTVFLIGLALHLFAWALLLSHFWQMQSACPVVDGRIVKDNAPVFPDELRGSAIKVSYWPYLHFRTPAMRAVSFLRSGPDREVGGIKLVLDVYRPRDAALARNGRQAPLPSLIYIHGGAWVLGTRRQSPFMMFELAAAGYVVFAIQYRLAPRAPLPAAIEDCKAAVAWVREHAAEYGGTPDAVVIGGSAGAHLAAMVALSADDKRFQPGFESADTRVRGAVLLYGFYDFTSRLEKMRSFTALRRRLQLIPWDWFFESVVFAARYSERPELFHTAEPTSHISSSAPPTLFIHGQNDSLVPISDSQRLHKALVQAGATSHLCEVPLAQHAFELVPSPLHQRTMRIILHFLERVTAKH